jgi:nuclear transport factor 2 (NTF2) superfamily protein
MHCKTLSAHQPSYLPWLGLVNKIAICDIFVSMDDVKFSKNSMYARNYIKIQDKKILLTVPTNNSDKNKLIKDVKICETNWNRRHINLIRTAYSKSPFFKNYKEKIEEIYSKKWKWLCDLNHEILFFIKEAFQIKTQIIRASDFSFEGNKNERLISYCNYFKAKKYLFGQNGKNYADKENFEKNQIQIYFQNFNCPNENLSFLDFIVKFGPEQCNLFAQRKKNEI